MNGPAGFALYPSWKQALIDLGAAEWQPGQVIEKELLEAAFGIDPPRTVADVTKAHQVFRNHMWHFRATLLEQHRLMLRALPGVGYTVVDPQHQTAVAMSSRGQEVARAIEKLGAELTHIRSEALDDAQRKANSDALAKVGALAAMIGRSFARLAVAVEEFED